MFKKLIATTASVVALSAAIFPLSPVHALGGATRALVLDDACMTYLPNGRQFGTLTPGLYPYMETVPFRNGRLGVMLRVYPRPYTRINVNIPISCVRHVRGRVIEY